MARRRANLDPLPLRRDPLLPPAPPNNAQNVPPPRNLISIILIAVLCHALINYAASTSMFNPAVRDQIRRQWDSEHSEHRAWQKVREAQRGHHKRRAEEEDAKRDQSRGEWDSERKQWNTERMEWDSGRAQWGSERTQWNAERAQWDLERAQWDSERDLMDSKRKQWDLDRALWDSEQASMNSKQTQWNTERKQRKTERTQWDTERKQWKTERTQWDTERKQWKTERTQWKTERTEWDSERRAWEKAGEKEAKEETERQRKKKTEEEERRRAGIHWLGLERSGHCERYGARKYWAKLGPVARGYDRLKACWTTDMDIHGRKVKPTDCEDKGTDRGVWGYWVVDFNEAGCRPSWEKFKDKGCTAPGSGLRRFDARLMNLDGADRWDSICSSTPTDFKGLHFDGAMSCVNKGMFGVHGSWNINDKKCR